jgi:hypothetical protein
MANLVKPRVGQVYSSEEILRNLDLRDTPFFMFMFNDHRVVIQTSHMTDSEVLSVEKFSDVRWKYIRETSEWIPIFHAVDNDEILRLVNIEKSTDNYDGGDGYWVTLVGHHREQYNGDGEQVHLSE